MVQSPTHSSPSGVLSSVDGDQSLGSPGGSLAGSGGGNITPVRRQRTRQSPTNFGTPNNDSPTNFNNTRRERPPAEDPQTQLANAWATALSDMSVEAKNGNLTSQDLTNELVSLNLKFMAAEDGPKPAKRMRNSSNAVSLCPKIIFRYFHTFFC